MCWDSVMSQNGGLCQTEEHAPQTSLGVHRGSAPGPSGTQNLWSSSPLHKMAWCVLTIDTSSIELESSLDYLQYLVQCKCYVNSCWCNVNSGFSFWNFLDFFSPNIFDWVWWNLQMQDPRCWLYLPFGGTPHLDPLLFPLLASIPPLLQTHRLFTLIPHPILSPRSPQFPLAFLLPSISSAGNGEKLLSLIFCFL